MSASDFALWSLASLGALSGVFLISLALRWATRQIRRRGTVNPIYWMATVFWGIERFSVMIPTWAQSIFRPHTGLRLPGTAWLRTAVTDRRDLGLKSPWKYWIDLCRHTPEQLRILRQLVDIYDRSEADLIRQGYTITSWDVYRNFVKAMVDTRGALKKRSDDYIYLITYLFMEPLRWFNNGRLPEALRQEFVNDLKERCKRKSESLPVDLSHPCFKSHHVVARWEEYANFTMDVAATRDHRMVRYLLSFDQSVAEYVRSQGIAGVTMYEDRSPSKVSAALTSWVLCHRDSKKPYQVDVSSPEDLKHFSTLAWKNGCGEVMKEYYQKGRTQCREALVDGQEAYRVYLVVPDEALENPEVDLDLRPDLQWSRVGEVFDNLYQAEHDGNEPNLFHTVVDLPAFQNYFATTNVSNKVPEDFFGVCRGKPRLAMNIIVNDSPVDKVFGLAVVNPDENLDKLEFHFLVPGQATTQARIGDMSRIFTFISSVCVPLYDESGTRKFGSRPVAELIRSVRRI